MHKNAFAAETLPPTPLRQLTALPRPPGGINGGTPERLSQTAISKTVAAGFNCHLKSNHYYKQLLL